MAERDDGLRREAVRERSLGGGPPRASRGGSAAGRGGATAGLLLAAALGGLALLGCRAPGGAEREPGERARVHRAPAPSERERYCAWYGDARDGVLYFGASPFWPAWREAGGEPTAELRTPGPQLVGRFDLARRRFRPPLRVAEEDAPGSVWDVLAHPNGLLYFTTFFGPAGSVDPATGAVRRFEGAGAGLAELALGPEGDLLASRYGGEGGAAVLRLAPDGALRAVHPLAPVAGRHVAAKSVAWDPVRREIWVTTDLLPSGETGPGEGGAEPAHDARVLAEDGRPLLRFARPELQAVAFGPDGTGYFAERDGALLTLRVRPPERAERALLTGRHVPLDDAFPAEHDFVQEIRAGPGGRAVVTRWSGRLHLVERDGRARRIVLPRPVPGGLYYTGVLADGSLCATFCGDVRVVCRELAP